MRKILTWLKSLFAREQARQIFHYRDGERPRSIDPLLAWRRFVEDPELDSSIHFDQLECGDTGLEIAATIIVSNAARRIFDLEQYGEANQGGVTDSEAIAVLRGYLEWCDDQKKSIERSLTRRGCTAAAS